jgi:hypothetical protein
MEAKLCGGYLRGIREPSAVYALTGKEKRTNQLARKGGLPACIFTARIIPRNQRRRKARKPALFSVAEIEAAAEGERKNLAEWQLLLGRSQKMENLLAPTRWIGIQRQELLSMRKRARALRIVIQLHQPIAVVDVNRQSA